MATAKNAPAPKPEPKGQTDEAPADEAPADEGPRKLFAWIDGAPAQVKMARAMKVPEADDRTGALPGIALSPGDVVIVPEPVAERWTKHGKATPA